MELASSLARVPRSASVNRDLATVMRLRPALERDGRPESAALLRLIDAMPRFVDLGRCAQQYVDRIKPEHRALVR